MPNPPGESRASSARHELDRAHNSPYAPDPIAAEIQAEINDHLATAAEQLQSRGATAEQARQTSQQEFGNATAISRRCYWIKQGDALMFRTAVILLLSLLCVALGATVFSTWRSQRQTAEQMAALAEQLKLFAEQNAVPISAAEAKPLEITGVVFLGSPDKPSSNTEIIVCRVSDGEIIRRVTTLGDGSFRSGPLGAGDYSLIVKDGRSTPGRAPATQTAPIYVYPGVATEPIKIDAAAYKGGQIGVRLSQPLPKLKVGGKYTIDSRLSLGVSSPRLQLTRWTAARPTPDRWPIYIQDAESNPNATTERGDTRSYTQYRQAVLSNDDLSEDSSFDFLYGRDRLLPPGRCSIVATIVADILPEGPNNLERTAEFYGSPKQSREWMSTDWVLYETMGANWQAKLLQGRSPPNMNRGGVHQFTAFRTPANVEIVQDEQTLVQIDIPNDLVSRIQSLVETVTDPEKFRDAVYKDNLFVRAAQVTVAGTQPLRHRDESDQ
jgi:hypothetical protein